MRLSEVLRCGYTHGISSLCANRKRGRVSLEDLREVESLRANTHPTSRPGPDLIAAHRQQTQAPDEAPTPDKIASLNTCTLQLTPAPSTAAESGGPSSEDCSTQQEEGSWGIGSRTGSLSDCLQHTSVVSSPAQVNLQLCLAHPELLEQQQQQQQQQRSADHTHDHHLQWQAHGPGQDALQQRAVLAGWAGKPDVQDMQDIREMQAGQLSWSAGNDDSDSSEAEDEELNSSDGTSDFEDAYSDYGTTEEEEENNSIPPADLEAILAENAKLWGQQQQQQPQQQQQQQPQQQQEARPLQAEQQMQAESQSQEQQQ